MSNILEAGPEIPDFQIEGQPPLEVEYHGKYYMVDYSIVDEEGGTRIEIDSIQIPDTYEDVIKGTPEWDIVSRLAIKQYEELPKTNLDELDLNKL